MDITSVSIYPKRIEAKENPDIKEDTEATNS